MKTCRSKRVGWLRLIRFLVGMMLSFSSALYAAEPLSITHSLFGYRNNGQTVTLDFTLTITNTGNVSFLDAEISLAPLGPASHRLLEPMPGESLVYIGDIPAPYENISVNCTVQSVFIVPEEEIRNRPLFWEITYTDETGRERRMLVESKPVPGV